MNTRLFKRLAWIWGVGLFLFSISLVTKFYIELSVATFFVLIGTFVVIAIED